MFIPKLLAATTAVAIGLGTLSIGAGAADAATTHKHVVHHKLVCKPGYHHHWVKVKGHLVLRCVKNHHHHKTMKHTKVKAKAKY